MQLIAEKLGKTDKLDRLRYLRGDGSSCTISMPRQGILPHDLVHYVVESALGLRHGFTSLVARGADASFAMDLAHHPDGKQVEAEAVQVEALVEALQTQLWSGQFSSADFLEGVRTASEARGFAALALAHIDAQAQLFQAAVALNERWNALAFYAVLTLDYPGEPDESSRHPR